MKKVLAFLLAMMMLVGVGCAWAEGTTEEAVEEATKYPDEITFQDIPWGSSKEEVKSWAKENGFLVTTDAGMYRIVSLDVSGKYVNHTGGSIAGYSYSSSGIDQFLYAAGSDSFQIAGYKIFRLDFSFDVKDGRTELVTVAVCIQSDGTNNHAQAISDDLEQKLITVYGENELALSSASSDETTNTDDYRYWKAGAEDTAICLIKAHTSVELIYGKTNAFANEEENDNFSFDIDSSNIDGL